MMSREDSTWSDFLSLAVTSSMLNNPTAHCKNDVLHDSRIQLRFYANIVIVPILVIGGLFGNITSIIIITSGRVSFGFPSTKLLVRLLASADCCYLLGAIFFQTMRAVRFDTRWPGQFIFPVVYPFVWPYMATVQTIETWFMVAITVDRYIAVSRPLEANSLCTAKKAFIVAILIFISSAIFNIPHWLEITTNMTFNPCTRRMEPTLEATPLFRNEIYQITYWSVLTMIFRFAMPLGLLTVLTTKLITMVRSASATRAKLTKDAKAKGTDHQVTKVLMSVVILFILCETIEFAMHVLQTLRWTWPAYNHFEDPDIQQTFNTIGNLMLVVSASINFVMYCIFAQKFRQEFFRMIFGKCRGQRDAESVSERSTSSTGI